MSRTSATAETTNTLLVRCAEPVFDTLAVVGVGLLGGSVALAAKRYGAIRRVIGIGRNVARLMQAQAAGVIDETATDLRNAASRADLLVFATPVQLIVPGVREAAEAARPGTVITDVGSTKARICRELSSGLPDGVTFVGSHPLAGSEKQGWEQARADLFDGRVCVLMSTEKGSGVQISNLADPRQPSDEDRSRPNWKFEHPTLHLTTFWRAMGMTVIEMSPEAHDRALAQTSHVPHAIASALARTLADENRPLAATGFADSTRIAAGDPNVWVPILLDNADAVLMSLDVFSAELSALREALARRDATKIRELWERGKTIRETIKVRRTET